MLAIKMTAKSGPTLIQTLKIWTVWKDLTNIRPHAKFTMAE